MLLSTKYGGGTAPSGGAVPPSSPPPNNSETTAAKAAAERNDVAIEFVEKYKEEEKRIRDDIIFVMKSDAYINEKGLMLKAIDMLAEHGYYEDNESLIMEYWKQ